MADTEAPAAAPAAPATPAKKGRKPKDGATKKAKSDRPPTMQLIEKAIESEKDPKGTSVLAIKKYITANYQVKSAQFLNHMLRRAFEAGLAAGKLSRPKGQGESHLLAGRYRLAVKEKKAKAAPAKPKKVVKKPKAAKSPAKKAAAKPKKAKTPKKKPAAAAKKAKSPKKVKKTPKKPAAKKTAAKKTPKKAAKKA